MKRQAAIFGVLFVAYIAAALAFCVSAARR